jgi:hypothetical protein
VLDGDEHLKEITKKRRQNYHNFLCYTSKQDCSDEQIKIHELLSEKVK